MIGWLVIGLGSILALASTRLKQTQEAETTQIAQETDTVSAGSQTVQVSIEKPSPYKGTFDIKTSILDSGYIPIGQEAPSFPLFEFGGNWQQKSFFMGGKPKKVV